MTSMLEREVRTESTAKTDPIPSPLDIPPVLDTLDSDTAAHRLNDVVEALVDFAKHEKKDCDGDNLYHFGDVRGKHIYVGREVGETPTGETVINTLGVTDPTSGTSGTRFYYTSEAATNQTVIGFSVHRECPGGSMRVDESSSRAPEISQQLAETLQSVVRSQDEIPREAVSDIVAPLTTPEESSHQPVRWLGSTVLGRLRAKVVYPAA